MSLLPPATVRIKRKATDEPVDFLRVNEGKRQLVEFVFSRRLNPGNELSVTSSSSAVQPTKQPQDVRKFHISRSSSRVGSPSQQKSSTVFVERKQPSKSSKSNETPPVTQNKSSVPTPDSLQSRPQKKPGLAARTASNRVREAPLKSGTQGQWDMNSEKLAAEMQAYTLQEISRSLARTESENPVIVRPSKSRFKPHKPTLRYHERHPEEFPPNDSDMDSDEDIEYIVDTYIRLAADEIDTGAEQNYGLLVLDSQPDIDQFYHEDSDQEEEENDEEEDENAEDHYTADYPDEEVDSDDEFGLNEYKYRNHNASDLEEWDQDDAAFSDEEGDSMRYPWAKK